jgi:predicted AAA+ superfamily ATPase
MIRRNLEPRLKELARRFPIVTVTGPRQSGKTTLCRAAFSRHAYVSLEAPDQRDYALLDPRGFLAEYAGGAVIDEVQRAPELLSYLQGEVDRKATRGRFILTGSANLMLLQSVSQSLAGRTAIVNLLPCGYDEVLRFGRPAGDLFEVMVKGGYPAIFDRRIAARDWFGSYLTSYLERDVRQVLNVGDLVLFQTFLRLCAGRAAQLLNLSQLGGDCGVSHHTARSWLSVLEASYVVYRLAPFHVNVSKRLVKTPKLYFFDSGLLCALLGIRDGRQLRQHPLRGAIFENWAVTEVVKARAHRGVPGGLYFLRDARGAEVDLLVETGDRLLSIEVKSGQTVAADFFSGFEKLAPALAAAAGGRTPENVLIYGGDTAQHRSAATVVPWQRVAAWSTRHAAH